MTTKYIIQRVINFDGTTRHFLAYNSTVVAEYDGPLHSIGERAFGRADGNVWSYASDLHVANERDSQMLDHIAEATAGLRKSLDELEELRRTIITSGYASTKPLTIEKLEKMISK